jgi:hypothetical protein
MLAEIPIPRPRYRIADWEGVCLVRMDRQRCKPAIAEPRYLRPSRLRLWFWLSVLSVAGLCGTMGGAASCMK